jgi:hypothetical protein
MSTTSAKSREYRTQPGASAARAGEGEEWPRIDMDGATRKLIDRRASPGAVENYDPGGRKLLGTKESEKAPDRSRTFLPSIH